MTDYTNGLLDELTATKAMEYLHDKKNGLGYWRDKQGQIIYAESFYKPSINIEQAMWVLEKMIKDGYKDTAMIYEREGWIVEFYKPDDAGEDGGDARDKSLPRAICLAALKAKEHD
jgi:hypothetical protein